MGANQSGQTRTVSMENDSPIGVIDVSDAVVQRLRSNLAAKGDAAKGSAQNSSDSSSASSKQSKKQQQPSDSPFTPPPPSSAAASNVPSSYPNPGQYSPRAFSSGSEPTITAIEVLRQKDAELAQNDLYWRRRMQQLEQTLNRTNAIMEKEYSAACENVRARFQNAPPTHQLPPCQDLKAQLIACYRSNPGESLRCADEVAAFTNCVSQNRIKKLDQEDQNQTGADNNNMAKNVSKLSSSAKSSAK